MFLVFLVMMAHRCVNRYNPSLQIKQRHTLFTLTITIPLRWTSLPGNYTNYFLSISENIPGITISHTFSVENMSYCSQLRNCPAHTFKIQYRKLQLRWCSDLFHVSGLPSSGHLQVYCRWCYWYQFLFTAWCSCLLTAQVLAFGERLSTSN